MGKNKNKKPVPGDAPADDAEEVKVGLSKQHDGKS